MVVAVSVVVLARDIRSELDRLIDSLDHQTLSTDAFELVVVDTGSTDGSRERLQKMATRRPNITVVELSGADVVDPSVLFEHCRGEYVLRLQPSQILFPQALERMLAEVVRSDVDAVSSRVCETGAVVADLWTADDALVPPESVASALAGPAVLVRRSLLDLAADPQTDHLSGTTRVAILSSYPALLQPPQPSGGEAAAVLSVDHSAISWEQGRLGLDLAGSISSDDEDLDLGLARPAALLRDIHSGQSFWLGSGEPLSASSDGGWSLVLEVDLRTVAVGGELPAGVYELDLQLVGVGDVAVPPVTVAWSETPAAVLGSMMVVAAPSGQASWQLDVGPTTWPLVSAPDPADATVTETAAGSLLVLNLPQVHVSGSTLIDGVLGLEALRLPARLVTDGTTARLEAFVSGLEGAPRIGTQLGVAGYQQTGLRLEIAHTGTMVVARVPPPAPKAVAKPAPAPAQRPAPTPSVPPAAPAKTAPVPAQKAPAQKAPAQKAPAQKAPAQSALAEKSAAARTAKSRPTAKPLTRVQHLRRALPSGLDPVVRKVSHHPLARRVYRKIANL